MKIVTVEEMRAIEQSAVEHGVSLDQLQLNAARAIADFLGNRTGTLLFLIGPGNNGRDALIAAAIHAERGGTSVAYLMPGVASEDVIERLRAAGGAVTRHGVSDRLEDLGEQLAAADCIVDGLLGIGARGAPREPMAAVIDRVNASVQARACPVISVDLPSGINADTGEVAGIAIRATDTVVLGCVKAGLLNPPASGLVGRLVPVEIGLPPETYAAIRREYQSAGEIARLLPLRPSSAHKGTFGRVLVVAGSRRFVGAPYLCGAAAGRSGCGLVTLAVPEWQIPVHAGMFPEATYLPIPDVHDATGAAAAAAEIAGVLPDCQAMAIGPGLGQGDAQTSLVMKLLETAARQEGLGVVVDADALNALAGIPEWWTRAGGKRVLTPHPGEMGRLTGRSTTEINAARTTVASEAAVQWGQVVVLKGAYTVIASPGGTTWTNPAAVSALATGGSGDVLTGLIAGLMAQGLAPEDAARAGVFVHAEAARRVLESEGIPPEAGRLLAGDLLPWLPKVLAGWSMGMQGKEKQKRPEAPRAA